MNSFLWTTLKQAARDQRRQDELIYQELNSKGSDDNPWAQRAIELDHQDFWGRNRDSSSGLEDWVSVHLPISDVSPLGVFLPKFFEIQYR